MIDGDESRPYAPNPADIYTETKFEGERVALEANGLGGLLTCAIRPGGIYGPGEKLMLARVVEECASGRFVATIGDGTALSDNTYVENLVDAQIEAARLTAAVPRGLLAGAFVWALGVHLAKGMKAVRLAERAGLHATSMGRGWQTLLLGFASPSLREERIARRRGSAP